MVVDDGVNAPRVSANHDHPAGSRQLVGPFSEPSIAPRRTAVIGTETRPKKKRFKRNSAQED